MTRQQHEAISHADLVAALQRHLDGLRRTADGEILYNLITRGLRRFEGNSDFGEAFVAFVHSLLDRYSNDPESHPATRIKTRLLQQRLLPYFHPGRPATAPRRTTATASPVMPRPTQRASIDAGEARLNQLRDELAQQLTQTLTAEAPLDETPSTRTPLAAEAFGDLKQLFLKGLDELIHERTELKRQLDAAGDYMRAVETDRERLNAELVQARQLGTADALTGLPKRDLFVRALEAEVGRVTRYGFSVALALLDLDGFSDINARYGREAGDAVLRCYARDILSHFRSYDLVARYGDDEFVVLFPNTQQGGAQHALEKARAAAAAACVTFRGATIALPGFSSVLTVYLPGEKVPALLARTESALRHAKRARPGSTLLALGEY